MLQNPQCNLQFLFSVLMLVAYLIIVEVCIVLSDYLNSNIDYVRKKKVCRSLLNQRTKKEYEHSKVYLATQKKLDL